MPIMIGSARIDERGKASGGAAGDQKQTATPDYSGEVSMQEFYVHSKGWYVNRLKDRAHAGLAAAKMTTACNNEHLGYDQNNRLGVIKYGVDTKTDTECDCSSLVRECIKEATGKDPGNFTTYNEVATLEKTGLFEEHFAYVSQEKTPLYNGDVLVTKTKGHTAIVVSGSPRPDIFGNQKKSVEEVAQEVIDGKWGNGDERRKKLAAAGYSYIEVQTAVNVLVNQSTVKKMVTEIAQEVIDGKWGNGDKRKQRLKAAGYDSTEVQRAVNKLLNR